MPVMRSAPNPLPNGADGPEHGADHCARRTRLSTPSRPGTTPGRDQRSFDPRDAFFSKLLGPDLAISVFFVAQSQCSLWLDLRVLVATSVPALSRSPVLLLGDRLEPWTDAAKAQ
jgi:hypothetical protein